MAGSEQAEKEPNLDALQTNETGFRHLIEQNADGVLIIDGQGLIRYANPAAETLMGRTRERLLGQPFGYPLANHHKVEIDIVRQSGSAVAEMHTAEILWAGETSYLASLRDITERKQLEQTLRQRNEELTQLHDALRDKMRHLKETQARLSQQEKLAAIGKLVAGLAHEMNNPLASIVLRAQLLQQDNNNQAVQHDLAEIVAQSQRLSQLVHSLLDFSRPITTEKKYVNVNAVVEEALSFMAYDLQSHYINRVTRLGDELPLVVGDDLKLQQILINIINNAWYAMYKAHGFGTLTITTEYKAMAARNNPAFPEGAVRVSVQDDGPGISENAQSRIFDPFFTTKPVGEGTGLGLALVHSMVTEQKGQVWVRSQPGHGTTFILEFPASLSAAVGEGENVVGETAVFPPTTITNARILVLDDETSLLNALVEILTRSGYLVEGLTDARTALAKLAHHEYHLLICDLMMPGLNGMDFYHEAITAHPGIKEKFVFITGNTVSPSSQKFFQDTEAAYLSKPFDLTIFLKLVREKLRQLAGEPPTETS
jgi:two-component system, NtrC family, sensor kinase